MKVSNFSKLVPVTVCSIGSLLLSPPAYSEDLSAPLTLRCTSEAGSPVTIIEEAKQDTENPSVLIRWETKEFGPKWSPQERCNKVTSKFNKLIEQNNGTLKDIKFVTGTFVTGKSTKKEVTIHIVCSVLPGQKETCLNFNEGKSTNHLMNIPSNANPEDFLDTLIEALQGRDLI